MIRLVVVIRIDSGVCGVTRLDTNKDESGIEISMKLYFRLEENDGEGGTFLPTYIDLATTRLACM